MLRTLLVVAGVSIASVGTAAAGELLRLERPDREALQMAGFELPRRATIDVDAVGLRVRLWNDLVVYAWVLDADTREPVWQMRRRDTDRLKDARSLRRAKETITLDPGRYELYLFSGLSGRHVISMDGDGWSIGNLVNIRWGDDDDDWDDYEEESEECYVSLASTEVTAGEVGRFEVTGELGDALIRFSRVGDSEVHRQGFELTRPMNLRIHSLVEYPKGYDGPADYAWIADAETREEVWRPKRRDTERAGGGDKNRLFDGDVQLEAGRYILSYGTDDSHSFPEFNVQPPHDPVNWGVTVLPGEGFSAGAFRTFDLPAREEAVISFTRAGDGDFFEQSFRLRREGDLLVYALGEYGLGMDEFADYAWIVDQKSGDTAWEMTRRNTVPAGGAEKNRRFEGVVHLAAGDYVLNYVTDDSHSYDEWNSASPIDPEAWGVSVFPAGDLRASDIEMRSAREVEAVDGDVLVRLVRVGDSERKRQSFTLDREERVRIYALGEGMGGEMYDFAYIVDDDSGDTVWEMRYRDTRHAGGARKNRVADETLTLGPGRYEVVYMTDGSHSFEGWNDSRPRDPMNWGVTVRRARD